MTSVSFDEVLSLLNFPDVALSGSCRRMSESVLPERDRLEKSTLSVKSPSFRLVSCIFFILRICNRPVRGVAESRFRDGEPAFFCFVFGLDFRQEEPCL